MRRADSAILISSKNEDRVGVGTERNKGWRRTSNRRRLREYPYRLRVVLEQKHLIATNLAQCDLCRSAFGRNRCSRKTIAMRARCPAPQASGEESLYSADSSLHEYRRIEGLLNDWRKIWHMGERRGGFYDESCLLFNEGKYNVRRLLHRGTSRKGGSQLRTLKLE